MTPDTTAFDYLSRFQAAASPRRAGSDGETQALAWLAERCRDLGLAVEFSDFTFVKSDLFRRLVSALQVALLLVLLAYSRRPGAEPLLVAAILLLLFLYLSRIHGRLLLRLARARSRNLLAGQGTAFSTWVERQDRPLVLICAHYDTAPNFPAWMSRGLDLFRIIGPLMNLAILFFVVYQVVWAAASLVARIAGTGQGLVDALRAFWIGAGSWLVLVALLPIVLFVVAFLVSRLLGSPGDAPGADDNGSGVALVLEMAGRLQAVPLENAQVVFAFWGAEELGLYGSRQFVRQYGSQLDRERTYVVNADVVGAGDRLLVHTGQGALFRRRTDPAVVEALERIASARGVDTIRSWESPVSGGSSDHAEWAERGFTHAISLLRENYRPLTPPARLLAWLLRIPDPTQLDLRHIHTARDTLDVIVPERLQETVDVCEAYVRWVDGRVGENAVMGEW